MQAGLSSRGYKAHSCSLRVLCSQGPGMLPAPPRPPPRGAAGPPEGMAVPRGPLQGHPRSRAGPLGPAPGGPAGGALLVAHMGRAVQEHLDGRALAGGLPQARGMGGGPEGPGLGMRRPADDAREGGRGGVASGGFSLAMGMELERGGGCAHKQAQLY